MTRFDRDRRAASRQREDHDQHAADRDPVGCALTAFALALFWVACIAGVVALVTTSALAAPIALAAGGSLAFVVAVLYISRLRNGGQS